MAERACRPTSGPEDVLDVGGRGVGDQVLLDESGCAGDGDGQLDYLRVIRSGHDKGARWAEVRLDRVGSGGEGGLALAHDTPHGVVSDGIAAVELPDTVQLVIAGGQPVRMVLGRPAGAGVRTDRERAELVEGEHPIREMAGDVLDAGQLGVPVGSVEAFQVLVRWKVMPCLLTGVSPTMPDRRPLGETPAPGETPARERILAKLGFKNLISFSR